MDSPVSIGAGRYHLSTPLGEGAMGQVFQAWDRLTGHMVALKHVRLSSDLKPTEVAGELLALGHEFRVLAGLRHPNIISVLDYGMNAAHQPFYTMELLNNAQTILEAGHSLPLVARVGLLIQALEALAYLHRRGILHHDLKPANILVADGHLRLLDFGLAVLADQPRDYDAFGTLQYLAPEVLDDQPYQVAADLYSLGIIAYELLVGHYPFPATTIDQFLANALNTPPDLHALATEQPALAAVLGQLLAKTPAERPADAQAVITALCSAVGLPDQAEPQAIRESYLQAATFVGRRAELARLTTALDQAHQGHGSAWLVGGESGVGKSRLLDELRIQALVRGYTVLVGQAVEEGGLPYQIWREPMRRLALATPITDLEAGVLMAIVPDIGVVLERPIPAAPDLQGALNAQRLIRIVVDLLQRHAQPLLLLLEDLQWAEECIPLLQEAIRLLDNHQIMIVGSYRDDEQPQLPSELPEMQVMRLARLDPAGIAQLSAAMLGENGRQPHVLAMLERETEGNTFFMVEVVRALAEESGRLADVGHTTLPAQVFTGGVQRLVQRRLQRVPPGAYPLLQLAASLGRQIDLVALHAVAPDTDLMRWLFACAEAQVLEVQGEKWRFAHDKLRAGALEAIPADELVALHRQAAIALETAYHTDLRPQASRLAAHYHQVGDHAREQQYARMAGDYASSTYAHAEAIRHYRRALELTSNPHEQVALLLAREAVFDWQGNRDAQIADLATLATLAETLDDNRVRFEVAQRRIQQAIVLGDFPWAASMIAGCVQLAQTLADPVAEVSAHLSWGIIANCQGDFQTSEAQLRLALDLARSARIADLEIDGLRFLAGVVANTGNYTTAHSLYEQALSLSRTLGYQRREAAVLNDISFVFTNIGDRATAVKLLEQALQINHMVGHSQDEVLILCNLGTHAHAAGDYCRATDYYRQAFYLTHLNRDLRMQSTILEYQGTLARELGDYDTAEQLLNQALHHTRTMSTPGDMAYVLVQHSQLALARGQPQQAEQHARVALQIREELGFAMLQQTILNVLGNAQLQQGDHAAAALSFQAVLDLPADQQIPLEAVATHLGLAQVHLAQGQFEQAHQHANHVLAWLDQHQADGLYDPIGTYLICYQVLAAQHDPRATSILEAGYHELQRRTASISDLARRQAYLQNVDSNRQLRAACEGQPPQIMKPDIPRLDGAPIALRPRPPGDGDAV